MKTLRLLRNIAAVFIFGATLLLLQPEAGLANSKVCTYKPGYNGCSFDKNGNCGDVKCVSPQACSNFGCNRCTNGFC